MTMASKAGTRTLWTDIKIWIVTVSDDDGWKSMAGQCDITSSFIPQSNINFLDLVCFMPMAPQTTTV